MRFYTHWAYFPDEESARSCAQDLSGASVQIDGPTDYRDEWLLRGEVQTGESGPDHDGVRDIVNQYGGIYDGGESTFGPGGSIPDPHLKHNKDYLKDLQEVISEAYRRVQKDPS